PGSIQAQQMDANLVQSFGVDGDGEVVALEEGGTLVRFVPGTGSQAGTLVPTALLPTASNPDQVQSFHIAPNGFVVAEIGIPQPSNSHSPYQSVYFPPGTLSFFTFQFNFAASQDSLIEGLPANPGDEDISELYTLPGGVMLVLVEADGTGGWDYEDYELFQITPTASGFETS